MIIFIETRKNNTIIKIEIKVWRRANMDEKKFAIKETVSAEEVKMLRKKMKESDSVEAAAHVLQAQIPEIEQCAANYIEKKGYDYPVTATLENCYFPVKQYGDMVFPAGNYNALNVRIGEATGKNWWCILYPTLCFVDSTYQTVPDESKEKLKENLTEEEYDMLLEGGENVEYGFWLWEWFR